MISKGEIVIFSIKENASLIVRRPKKKYASLIMGRMEYEVFNFGIVKQHIISTHHLVLPPSHLRWPHS